MDKKFILNIKGKDFVLFEGLLDEAHKQGLFDINTELICTPCEDNGQMAIVKAQARTEKGQFSGIGDASPANVNSMIAPHVIRMAETRAIARALRLACNIGMASSVELGEDKEPQKKSNEDMGIGSLSEGPGPDERELFRSMLNSTYLTKDEKSRGHKILNDRQGNFDREVLKKTKQAIESRVAIESRQEDANPKADLLKTDQPYRAIKP